ncbi:CapA family protein [Promicromonospora sp. NPDC059942]|uniref:CapA family protein n=1 Tax=Promicromonospora sp. NPDC059942 TaxID=3347009 RepID=UPI0036581874
MVNVRPLRFLASAAVTCALAATPAACTPAPGAPGPTGSGGASTTSAPATPPTSATPSPEPMPTPTPQDVELTLLAAGDVLTHEPVNDSATGPDGFDYSPLLAGIDPWVARADLALCHLEVPVAPKGTQPAGYPVFRAPKEIVRDLGEQGWDGCSTASNHAADSGYDGIAATLGALDRAGMGHAGTARNKRESSSPQLYELRREGRTVTIAHLSAAYGLNGLEPPHGSWSVDLIDSGRIVEQARAARAAGADLVVVSLHDGTEYVTQPTDHQKETAKALAKSRQVDLVIGHHAHVPQPLEHLRGGPGGDGMWVAYGLGNLLSNQGTQCCVAASAVGLLLVADVVQHPGGPARVTDARWAATTVDRAAGHRLHWTRDALAHPDRGQLGKGELTDRLRIAQESAGDAADEQRRPPKGPAGEPPVVVRRTS